MTLSGPTRSTGPTTDREVLPIHRFFRVWVGGEPAKTFGSVFLSNVFAIHTPDCLLFPFSRKTNTDPATISSSRPQSSLKTPTPPVQYSRDLWRDRSQYTRWGGEGVSGTVRKYSWEGQSTKVSHFDDTHHGTQCGSSVTGCLRLCSRPHLRHRDRR